MDYTEVHKRYKEWEEKNLEEITSKLAEEYKLLYGSEEKFLLKEATGQLLFFPMFALFLTLIFYFNFTISIFGCGAFWLCVHLYAKQVVRLCVKSGFENHEYMEIIDNHIVQQREKAYQAAKTELEREEIDYFYNHCSLQIYRVNFKYIK